MSNKRLLALLVERFKQDEKKDELVRETLLWGKFFQWINFFLVITLSLLLFTFGFTTNILEKHETLYIMVSSSVLLFLGIFMFVGLVSLFWRESDNPRSYVIYPNRHIRTEDRVEKIEKEIIEELEEKIREREEETKN
jgi:hypothetical protein